MCTTTTSSSSTVSYNSDESDHAEEYRFPKRYKQMFNPDYNSANVSDLTRRRWAQSALDAEENISDSSQNLSNAERHDSNSSAEEEKNDESAIWDCHINTDNSNSLDAPRDHNEINNSILLDESYNDMENDILQGEVHMSDNDSYSSQGEYHMSDNDTMCGEDDDESESSSDEEAGERHDVLFDRVMFPQANLQVRDVMLLITAVSLRLKLSDEGKTIIGDMVQILAGEEFSDVSLSKHMTAKCISTQQEHINCHYYCSNCSKAILLSVNGTENIKNRKINCTNCKKQQEITSKSCNYFLSLNLKHEMEVLLSNSRLKNDILANVIQRKNNPDNDDVISDIHNGSVYKNIVKYAKIEKENEYVATVNVSTDGAPLTNSGKKGFWPVQVMLNDLSPKNRFKHLLLSGLMLTEKEPESNLLNLYVLTVFVQQMKILAAEGVSLLTDTGEKVLIKFYVHACVVDAIARRILQNRIQFNGYFGCSWCYQLGLYIKEVKGIRYVVSQPSELRTHASHLKDVRDRVEKKLSSFRGVKGDCCLSELPYLDLVWSFAFEILHGLFLGDAFTIMNELKNGKSEFRISAAQVALVEKRFLKITPIREIHRLPRSGIIKGSAKPKGVELKWWLLHYSLPCLDGVFKDDTLLKHYSILVHNSYKLLTTNLTKLELNQVEEDLLTYVNEYEMHYEDTSLTFNIHTISHMAESVRKTGPLIFNSALPFESNIFHLKQLVGGPKGMDKQISRKFLQTLIFKSGNLDKLSTNERVEGFCSRLFSPSRFSTSFRHGEDAVFCGKGEIKLFDQLGNRLSYKKCIFNGTIYTSNEYKQATKTDDSIVKLKSGEFCKILNIIDNDTNCYLKLRIFELFPDLPFPPVSHIKKIRFEETNHVRIVPITEIEQKALLLNVRTGRYVSTMPNTIEIQ